MPRGRPRKPDGVDESARRKIRDRYSREYWQQLLADAVKGATSDWDRKFVASITQRYDEYGLEMFLSDKQVEYLNRAASNDVLAWWNVMGLQRDATAEQINARWRELAIEHHPDRGGSPRRMTRINVARDMGLKHAASR
jgi:DnaJ domain